jgi:hypothetical protein
MKTFLETEEREGEPQRNGETSGAVTGTARDDE